MTESAATPAKKSNLPKRIVSAAVMIPIALGAALAGGYWLGALIAVAVAIMCFEWTTLTPKSTDRWVVRASALLAIILVLVAAMPPAQIWSIGVSYKVWYYGQGPMVLLGIGGFAVLTVVMVRQRMGAVIENIAPPVLGFLYIVGPAMLVLLVRGDDPTGRNQLLVLLTIIWSMDSGAYFAGKSIGGPKLAPSMSPNKTWAGLLGGMATAGIAAPAMAGLLAVAAQARPQDVVGLDIGIVGFAIAGALIGGWSQIGDLLESTLKRKAGVKDSGSIIPGHGGVLDRLDGLLFAAPLFFLVTRYLALDAP
ncbi:MAG: phosphatidate cytidylyltransferase [Alphaproteobacteria bacterium]